jgi:hypothetical protein
MSDDWYNASQLHFAAQDGDLARVAQLLSDGYLPNSFDDIGRTPLHYAVECEHFDVVDFLIANGADINANDEAHAGNTPIAEVAQTCSLKWRSSCSTMEPIRTYEVRCNSTPSTVQRRESAAMARGFMNYFAQHALGR